VATTSCISVSGSEAVVVGGGDGVGVGEKARTVFEALGVGEFEDVGRFCFLDCYWHEGGAMGDAASGGVGFFLTSIRMALTRHQSRPTLTSTLDFPQ
jgi:hypothetical protein